MPDLQVRRNTAAAGSAPSGISPDAALPIRPVTQLGLSSTGLTPDAFEPAPPGSPPVHLADNLFVPAEAFVPGAQNRAFRDWVEVQVKHQPQIRATFEKLSARLNSGEPPQTIGELVTSAITAARECFQGSGETNPQVITAVAVVALAAQGFRLEGSAYDRMPQYIPDGRPAERGFDKTGHMVTQAMFTYLSLFDRAYGTGSLQTKLSAAAAEMDAGNVAAPIAEAYERARGAIGPLFPGVLAGAPEDGVIPYFERPSDLTPIEAAAYDEAVRVGDAYEHLTTPLPYDPARLGDHPQMENPTARLQNTAYELSGLMDPGVNRDLTADRIGAWLGIQLFRSPDTVPHIPFDEGAAWQSRPYADSTRGTFGRYYGEESAMVAKLLPTDGSDGFTDATPHRDWAAGAGVDVAHHELRRKMSNVVDRLAPDRERLAHYYANFCVRQLRMGVGDLTREGPGFDDHLAFARSQPLETVKEHLLARVDAVANAFRAAF